MKHIVAEDLPTDITRRGLLLGAAGASLAHLAGCGGGGGGMGSTGGAASAGPQLVYPIASQGAGQTLPTVPLDEGVVDSASVRTFALAVQAGTTQFRSGINASTLGYNGALLGPALRLRSGERTSIRVHNGLGELTTVHWHGLILPAEVDGGPHQPIAPGSHWDANFIVSNPASTCWFHPHAHGATGRQVVSGLAGLLIVDDPASRQLTLPYTWGIDDLALVLQDKRFTSSGQIDYTLTANDRLLGYMGDSLLVNGALAPVWQAPRQWVRLRLLNGCNARILTLRLGNSIAMLQVANEAGLLATPVWRSSVALAPGERVEVLVDFSDAAYGQEVPLVAGSAANGMGMGMGSASSTLEVIAMTIRVSLPKQPNAIATPPVGLVAAPSVVAYAGATLRSFNLDGGMMSSPFTINARQFDIGRIDFTVPANAVEIWKFFNTTSMAHPMHVHGVRMSLLARDGVAPATHEQGLRDTFIVDSMQTLTIAVQTPATASLSPLMVHCHILEHEDAGMMAQFITV